MRSVIVKQSAMRLIIFIFFFLGCFNVGAQGNEEKSVKGAFATYKKSILKGDGKAAVECIDARTITYYGKMLSLTLEADSAEVAGLDLMDKLTVLSLRHRLTRSEMEGFDGRQLFVYSIEKGMVGKNSVANVEMGEIIVEGGRARGQLVALGEESPLYFQFNKEDGRWKLDLTSLFGPTTEGLKQMLSDRGMTENEFIFQALEITTGKPVTNTIWFPE